MGISSLTKICTKCSEEKSLTEFNKKKDNKDNLSNRCRTCTNKYGREYYKNNPEKQREKSKLWHKNNRERTKNNILKLKFGINLEEYRSILKKQNYCCNICGVNEKDLNQSLSVDHCHTTGKIRGLLCNICNVSLGGFKDSKKILQKAMDHLDLVHEIVMSKK